MLQYSVQVTYDTAAGTSRLAFMTGATELSHLEYSLAKKNVTVSPVQKSQMPLFAFLAWRSDIKEWIAAVQTRFGVPETTMRDYKYELKRGLRPLKTEFSIEIAGQKEGGESDGDNVFLKARGKPYTFTWSEFLLFENIMTTFVEMSRQR